MSALTLGVILLAIGIVLAITNYVIVGIFIRNTINKSMGSGNLGNLVERFGVTYVVVWVLGLLATGSIAVAVVSFVIALLQYLGVL